MVNCVVVEPPLCCLRCLICSPPVDLTTMLRDNHEMFLSMDICVAAWLAVADFPRHETCILLNQNEKCFQVPAH